MSGPHWCSGDGGGGTRGGRFRGGSGGGCRGGIGAAAIGGGGGGGGGGGMTFAAAAAITGEAIGVGKGTYIIWNGWGASWDCENRRAKWQVWQES